MVKSMQSTELGKQWFTQLKEEVETATETAVADFQTARNPDDMGPDGEEEIDDED